MKKNCNYEEEEFEFSLYEVEQNGCSGEELRELFNLGERYDEISNLISRTEDCGVFFVESLLNEIDYLTSLFHRNTKKATVYTRYKNHQRSLKRLQKNNPEMVEQMGHRGKLIRHYVKRNKHKHKSAYNRKALRQELKNISLDVSSGSFYKNIRGREKTFSYKCPVKGRHINLKRNMENLEYGQGF